MWQVRRVEQLLSLALLGAPLLGEVPVPVAPPPPPPPPTVFDLDPKPAPITSKSSVSGVQRYMGDEPDYNTAQRQRWLDICAPKKEVDYNAYRECYADEKRKSTARQKQKRLRGKAGDDSEALPGGLLERGLSDE